MISFWYARRLALFFAAICAASCAIAADSLDEQGSNAGERVVVSIDGVEYAFRWAPSGTFMMGSSKDGSGEVGGDVDYGVLHKITLTKGFWILETETTQKMWLSTMGANPSKFQGDDRPVDTVSFNDAVEFCKKIGDKARLPEGRHFQLPTEAQWEYAARAGVSRDLDPEKLKKTAWFGDDHFGGTHDAATKEPNDWGIFDMQGNLWEWTADKSGAIATDETGNGIDSVDPTGATDEETPANLRVDRGGCWDSDAYECGFGYRGYYDGDRKGPYVGFRFIYVPK